MGRRAWDDISPNKTKIITLRLSESEFSKLKFLYDEEMKQLSYYQRVSFSEYIRRKIFK